MSDTNYSSEKIAAVLEKHAKHLRGEADGERAYLGDAKLGYANLRGANLRGAYLGGADLGRADLGGAYLGRANLRGAYLGGADLRGAYLGGADLGRADLGRADLRGAYLGRADLGRADLRGANLGYANLRGAYLGRADLGGADLGGAESLLRISSCDGYDVLLVEWEDGPRIQAGCRWFTVEEARKHWGDPINCTPREPGDGIRHCRLMLTAVAALLELASAMGWKGIP